MAARNYTDDDRSLIRLLEDDFAVADDHQDAMYLGVMLRNAPLTPKPLNSRTLSMFLHDAAGRRTPMERSFLNKTEIHVICRPVGGLFNHGFVARYTRFNHSLKLRAEIDLPEDFFVYEGSFIVGLSTVFHPAQQPHLATERTNLEVAQAAATAEGAAPASGWEAQLLERNLEVGQAVASITLAAGAFGWEARLLGPSLGFRALGRLMGLASETDMANEFPVAAILVFPTPDNLYRILSISEFKSTIMKLFNDDGLQRKGRGSHAVITPEERPDDIFRHVTFAEKTDGEEYVRLDRMRRNFTGPGSFRYGPHATMRRVLNSRRCVSVADFDENYTMPYGQLEQFLVRCLHDDSIVDTRLRRACFPVGALPWHPRVNVFVFVNRVEGFRTGLYCFVRKRLPYQRGGSSSSDTPYQWKPLPIPSLDAGRHVASFLGSFYQFRVPAAAPDQPQLQKSAFVVALVAPFKDVTEEKYVYLYSRQIWEAGFLGEVLAVEAQAQGLSASALNSRAYNWQPTLGINTADGNIISVYAVGKPRTLGQLLKLGRR